MSFKTLSILLVLVIGVYVYYKYAQEAPAQLVSEFHITSDKDGNNLEFGFANPVRYLGHFPAGTPFSATGFSFDEATHRREAQPTQCVYQGTGDRFTTGGMAGKARVLPVVPSPGSCPSAEAVGLCRSEGIIAQSGGDGKLSVQAAPLSRGPGAHRYRMTMTIAGDQE